MYLNAKGYVIIGLLLLMIPCGLNWADETDLVWSTFLGGSGGDHWPSIAVDANNNVYLTGMTGHTDFPTTPGAFDTTFNGVLDVFVAKLHLLVDTNPPQAINDLTAQLQGGFKSWAGNIHLSWSEPYDNIGVSHYVVYRSNEPNSIGDSLDLVTSTAYTDMNVSAIGHPYFHVYYTVKAVDEDGNKSPDSNQVGEFDKLLMW
jgi:hypothetical protein